MKEKLRPKKLNMDDAIQALNDYCVRNGYDAGKIDRYQRGWDVVAALKENDAKPNGLCNDMETLPYVVLYYDENGAVHETEHTAKISARGAE